jgi:hypothetical protein
MLTSGTNVNQNDQIAVLGTAYSTETSGERRHLHLGILKGNTVSLLGYVQKQSDLSGWSDPVEFLKTH